MIRGLASLAVCLYHFRLCNIEYIGSSQYYLTSFRYGWTGVEAFFVLSGFIIPFSLIKTNYSISLFFKFLAKRCLRIEPPYLVSILLIIVLGYLGTRVPGFRGENFEINFWNLLSHIGYLPEHLGYIWLNPVYWSLEAEFHFYILIGLLLPMLWKTKNNLIIGLIIGLICSFLINLYVFSYMPFFVMGIAACAKRLSKINTYWFWSILASAFAVCLMRTQPIIMPLVGIFTSLAIVYIEFKTIITDFLGKISFSLYLIHVPVGGKVINYFGRYCQYDWQVWAVLAIAIAITLFFSYLFYRIIEYPSQILSKRIAYRSMDQKNNKFTKGGIATENAMV